MVAVSQQETADIGDAMGGDADAADLDVDDVDGEPTDPLETTRVAEGSYVGRDADDPIVNTDPAMLELAPTAVPDEVNWDELTEVQKSEYVRDAPVQEADGTTTIVEPTPAADADWPVLWESVGADVGEHFCAVQSTSQLRLLCECEHVSAEPARDNVPEGLVRVWHRSDGTFAGFVIEGRKPFDDRYVAGDRP